MAKLHWGLSGALGVVVLRLVAACGEEDERTARAPLGDAAPSSSAATDPTLPEAAVPSFCNGIVLFASFDTSAAAQLGGGEPRVVGAAKQLPSGRFGGALGLSGNVSDDNGAALYFVRPDGGAPVFPENEGSLAMWMRGDIADGQPVYYRPLATLPPDTLVSAGLSLVATTGRFGLVHSQAGLPTDFIHAFPIAAVRPYLRPNDFNHFVTSWRRGDAAGPTAYLTINGGEGQNFLDAGADAADPFADASPDDAGNLAVPYRGYSSKKWDDDASAVALRLGASDLVSAPNATIDDTAVWDRVLSHDEVAAMYQAGVSIREACRLP